MRIVFCTASLEPAEDALGDYTRRLAAACCEFGHTCMLLGLADRHIEQPTEETESCLGVALGTLRLPKSQSWEQRVTLAHDWLKGQSPHWISLQFPSLSFHPKGLIRNLAPHLVQLVDGGCALHVMLHERSIGVGTDSPSWQQRLIGTSSRRAALLLLRQLRPDAIHVSSEAGMQLLERHGVTHARVLELPNGIFAQPNDANESSMAAIGAQFLSDIGAEADRGRQASAQAN